MAEPECGRNVSKAYKCMYMYIYELTPELVCVSYKKANILRFVVKTK